MFCARCGNQLEPSARFCAACGAAVGASAPPPPPFSVAPGLYRPRANRMIAGVCAAFARQYGWDVTVICAMGETRHREPYELVDGIAIHRFALKPAEGGLLGYAR